MRGELNTGAVVHSKNPWPLAGSFAPGSDDRRPPRGDRTDYCGQAGPGRGLLGPMEILRWQLVGEGPDGGSGVPTSTALSVLDDARAAGIPRVEFVGTVDGRPDFFELIEYAVGLGIGIGFATGGSMIDEPTARWLAVARAVEFTLVLDEETDGGALDALRLFARVPVRGFTVRLPADGRAGDEVLDLAGQCRARLRSDGAQPRSRAGADPTLFIDVAGDVFDEVGGVKIGSIVEVGGFLAAWRRSADAGCLESSLALD